MNTMMMMRRTAGMVTRRLVVVGSSPNNGCASRSSFSPSALLSFSTTASSSSSSDDDASTDLSLYFHIEASNAARPDATQLTVSGPDIDGMLASMTVALAVRGCSLMELHAAKSSCFEDSMMAHHHTTTQHDKEEYSVKDIFCVTNRSTGKPFEDHELEALAGSLLESLKTPMNVVSVKGAMTELKKLKDNLTQQQDNHHPKISLEDQITIIPSIPAVVNKD
jgi:hypothetical protein